MIVDILKELDKLNVVVVSSAPNDPTRLTYPAQFLRDGQFDNLIVVGSTDAAGKVPDVSRDQDWVTTFAPGRAVNIPDISNGRFTTLSGTSYGMLPLRPIYLVKHSGT
jgi:hypothetical protein